MKRRLTVFAMTAVMAVSAVAVTACSGSDLRHVDAKDATCTEAGNTEYWTDGIKYYGDGDGKTEIEFADVKIDALGHTPKSEWRHDDDGHWHLCSVCGKVADTKEAHEFGDWIYITAPTSTSAGFGYTECACGYRTGNQVIPPSGTSGATLTHVPAEDSKCDKAGHLEFWTDGKGNYYADSKGTQKVTYESLLKDRLPHTPDGDYINTSEDGHWQVCSVCKKPASDPIEHTLGNWIVDVEATAGAPGKRHKVCDVCGYETPESDYSAAGVVIPHPAVKATCFAPGNSAYWELNGRYYSDEGCTTEIAKDSWVLSQLTHVPSSVYDSDGERHWHVCANDTVNSHSAGDETACTPDSDFHYDSDDKAKGHWHVCTVCGKDMKAADHDYAEDVIAPTCNAGGYTTYTCECGYSYRGSETAADPSLHDYSVSVFVKDSEGVTTANGGVFHKFCSLCNADGGPAVPAYAEAAYNDRWIKIGDTAETQTQFGAYTAYTDNSLKDKGVTFDAVASDGLFVVDLSKFTFAENKFAFESNTAVRFILGAGQDLTATALNLNNKPLIIDGEGSLAIPDANSRAVTVDGGTLTVTGNYVNSWNESVFTVNGGAVTVNGSSEAKNVFVNGGTVTLNTLGVAENLTVTGGSLRVNGTASIFGKTVIKDGAVTFVSDLNTADLTVGDGSGNPTVDITRHLQNNITDTPAVSYTFHSGTTTVSKGTGWLGIEVAVNGGNILLDGTAKLILTGNQYGINNKAGALTIDIRDSARFEISSVEHAALQNQESGTAVINLHGGSFIVTSQSPSDSALCEGVTLNVSGGEARISSSTANATNKAAISVTGGSLSVSAENAKALYDTDLTVNGGKVMLSSKDHCVELGNVTLTAGTLTAIKIGEAGNAAFASVASIEVAQGFNLGVKDYHRVLYYGEGSAPDPMTVEQAIAVDNVAQNSDDPTSESLGSGTYVAGTIAPGEITVTKSE